MLLETSMTFFCETQKEDHLKKLHFYGQKTVKTFFRISIRNWWQNFHSWVNYSFTFTLVPNNIAHSECVLLLTVSSNAFIVLSIKSWIFKGFKHWTTSVFLSSRKERSWTYASLDFMLVCIFIHFLPAVFFFTGHFVIVAVCTKKWT